MIYLIRNTSTGNVKIGYTKGKVKRRLKALQIGCDSTLEIALELPGEMDVEGKLHRALEADRIRGEWFRDNGSLIQRVIDNHPGLCCRHAAWQQRRWRHDRPRCLSAPEARDEYGMPLCKPCEAEIARNYEAWPRWRLKGYASEEACKDAECGAQNKPWRPVPIAELVASVLRRIRK